MDLPLTRTKATALAVFIHNPDRMNSRWKSLLPRAIREWADTVELEASPAGRTRQLKAGFDYLGHDARAIEAVFDQIAGAPRIEEIGVLMSDVQPEDIDWLWPGRVPYGKLTLIDGDPGLGKSTLALDIAARLSAGRAFPESPEVSPAGVVILSAEDGLADTIRPRLDAAGAAIERILALSTVGTGLDQRFPAIPSDIDEIAEAIARVDARLLIIDPLVAFLGPEFDSFKDQSVRRALAPLHTLAADQELAVLLIRHLNKNSGHRALYRGGGSIGIIGAARSAMLVAADPDDDAKRVLAPLKNNLAMRVSSLSFRLRSAPNGHPTIEWIGESQRTADELLSASPGKNRTGARAEAEEFLREVLADGPHPANGVTSAALDKGITLKTLNRARGEIGVHVRRQGFGPGSQSVWELPGDSS